MQAYIKRKKDEMMDGFLSNLNERFGGAATETPHDFSEYRGDPVRFIEEIFQETLTDDTRKMLQSVVDHDFTIAMSGNSVGKSFCCARLALYFFLCYTAACEVYLVATSEQQLRRVLWKELLIVIERFPELFVDATVQARQVSCGPSRTISATVIPLAGTESAIEGKLSGSHVSGHEGKIAQVYILDEADSLPNAPAVWRAIESALSGPGAKAIALFNPRHPVGELQEMVRKGIGNVVTLTEFDHPNVVQGPDKNGLYPIPGAITRSKVIQRTHAWTRPLQDSEIRDDSCFDLPEYLCGIEGVKDKAGNDLPSLLPGWRKVTSPEYSYMVLARFPGMGSRQLISMEWINSAIARRHSYISEYGEIPPTETKAVMGMDVAEFGSDANCAVFRYGGYVEPLITWSGIDILSSADRASEEYKVRKVIRCNTDGTGVGAGVAPAMRRNGCNSVPVITAARPTTKVELGEFRIMRDQLWWACREWLRTDPGAMIPDDPDLVQELLCPTFEVINGRIQIMRKADMRDLLKRSPDRADALCLTFFEPELLFNL